MTPRAPALYALALVAAVASLPPARDLSATRVSRALHSAGLSPDSISGMAGQTHDVALLVDMDVSGRLLASYSVALTWDSTVMRLDSARAGTFVAPIVNYVSGGEVRLAQAVGAGSGVGGVITLARLHFRIVSDTIGRRTPINVAFTDLVATDFTDLRTDLELIPGVARVLPPTVVVRFAPDSLLERVGHRPMMELVADLSAAPGVALGSYAASVTWDSTVMRLDSLHPGDLGTVQDTVVSAGELRLAAADAEGNVGAVSLARAYFTFLGEGFPRLTSLTPSVTEMRAARTFANLLPGVTARSGRAVIGGVLRGDIDVNGAVAALDAQLILQGVVGLPLPPDVPGMPHGDADCGGTLQAKDAQLVLNAVVGNPVAQFCVARIQ